MPGTDPNRRPLLRAKVREVLAMAPTRRFTEAMLREAVNLLIAVPAEEAEISEAIEWNQGKGLVDYEHNPDWERDEWHLTERGKAKEGCA